MDILGYNYNQNRKRDKILEELNKYVDYEPLGDFFYVAVRAKKLKWRYRIINLFRLVFGRI